MNSVELIILNFKEIRRRSIKLWEGIPQEYINWKPDKDAMSIIQMGRHVLEGEYEYHTLIKNRGNLGDNYKSPWVNKKFVSIEDEIQFAEPYHNDFLSTLILFNNKDLSKIMINRKSLNQERAHGDYLLRVAYHESVHTGQMLSYLRILSIPRPLLWD